MKRTGKLPDMCSASRTARRKSKLVQEGGWGRGHFASAQLLPESLVCVSKPLLLHLEMLLGLLEKTAPPRFLFVGCPSVYRKRPQWITREVVRSACLSCRPAVCWNVGLSLGPLPSSFWFFRKHLILLVFSILEVYRKMFIATASNIYWNARKPKEFLWIPYIKFRCGNVTLNVCFTKLRWF